MKNFADAIFPEIIALERAGEGWDILVVDPDTSTTGLGLYLHSDGHHLIHSDDVCLDDVEDFLDPEGTVRWITINISVHGSVEAAKRHAVEHLGGR